MFEISEKLELEVLSEDRKLSDEEIDYEYIDFLIAETLENLKDDVCTCEVDCGVEDCCGTRVEKNLKKVYEIALYDVKRWNILWGFEHKKGLLDWLRHMNFWRW